MQIHKIPYTLSIIILFCIFILISTCSRAVAEAPFDVFVVYYPYDFTGHTKDFSPRPGYASWTIERMERDIKRMADNCIHGALLALAPEDLADSHKLFMLRRFLDIVSTNSGNFKVILLISPLQRMQLGRRNVVSYIENKGVTTHKAYYSTNGKPLICFSENVILTEEESGDYEYMNVHLGYLSSETDFSPALPVSRTSSGLLQFSWILPGYCAPQTSENNKRNWILKRKKATAFKKSLKTACQQKTPIIVINSWNGYYNGTAIEPNTLDDFLMMNTLGEFFEVKKK